MSTTAELEVLRQSLAALLVMALKPLSPSRRSEFLKTFEKELGDVPADYTSTDERVTAFHEAVAAEMPARAAAMANSVRKLLADIEPSR